MNPKNKYTLSNHAFVIALLGIAGVLFAGFLSFSKIFLQKCALNEGCSYFFGIPTCIIGFTLFLQIFILAVMRLKTENKEKEKYFSQLVQWISGIGILFSGYYAIQDIFFPLFPGLKYALILPSCAYGFFVFIIVFALNWKYFKKK